MSGLEQPTFTLPRITGGLAHRVMCRPGAKTSGAESDKSSLKSAFLIDQLGGSGDLISLNLSFIVCKTGE